MRDSLLYPWMGVQFCQHLRFQTLASRTMREWVAVGFKPPNLGSSVMQETNVGCKIDSCSTGLRKGGWSEVMNMWVWMGVKFQISSDRVESKGRGGEKQKLSTWSASLEGPQWGWPQGSPLTPCSYIIHPAWEQNPVRDWEEPASPSSPVGSINTRNFFS